MAWIGFGGLAAGLAGRPGVRVKRLIGRTYLWLLGWRCEGELPTADKYVVIAAPHTSNWDMPAMIAFAWAFGMPSMTWMGKDSLFRFPLKTLLTWLGGLPIERSESHNLVESLAEEFGRRDQMVLAIPPSGTRGRRDYWKSGFYFIARAAGVPIAMSFLDYSQKRGGFGPTLVPGEDLQADMDLVRAFYQGKIGRYPDKMSTIRLRAETGETA